MSRPRKPTAHLELVGAFKKNPQRTRDDEPQCEEDAIHPPFPLSDDARTWWDFLIGCAVPGVITKMDSAYLGLVCMNLADAWSGEKSTQADRDRVGKMLGKLGMTPAERSNIVVPKKKAESKFAQFKQG